MQNVKAYLRRETARESLLHYKEALEGENTFIVLIYYASHVMTLILTQLAKIIDKYH